MIKIGLIGYGYWGPNLLRNFLGCNSFKVEAVADSKLDRVNPIKEQYPTISCFDNAEAILTNPDIDAVAIATPVGTHFKLARTALENGKHVLVEKPLTSISAEAEELVNIARKNNLTLMVDHTFLFTGAVQMMKSICQSSDFGHISYIDSMRANLGLFQPDINVLWDLAPHDLSIIDYLMDDYPLHIEADGYCHVNMHLPDIAYLTVHMASNAVVHLNMSWMSPVKVRRFAVGGTNKMLLWDDLDRDEKIKIYDTGIEFQPEEDRKTIIPEYRIGNIFAPRVPNTEALAGVVEHFGDVIQGQAESIMCGEKGLRIVKILETAQEALDKSLSRVSDS